ncbi:TRAP transporter small permease [Hoeflea sp. WL0058]|uniref:TRAP transporter small permease protein n=1 Tax=Flavimaribacter sediminis TaxID=2865987 RepID=A0AAE2ZJ94_9HYPH|nr:TRAP transporter small permease [Flavimaribacter sediminis]MBW8637256.1 TRAP transporter small permease [Flavimaribacter sediminis]
MQRLSDIIERIVRLLALLGALGVIAMMLHVALDVTMRGLFGAPIPATVEIVSHYYMVFIAFLPLAWVERRNGMVSVEVLEGLLPAPLLRVSDLLVAILVTAIYATIAIITWKTAMTNFNSGSFVIVLNYRIPTWPTYFLPPAGFGLAAFVTAWRAFETLLGAVRPEQVHES